ncbi:DUF1344 domain-containing protein [Aquamicrobium zhengzhouense]|nr:DUF1344 domain-containing protein [Aquamicrobium zhengzhouense]
MQMFKRIFIAAAIAVPMALVGGAAHAAEDEGKIARVDVANLTITLDNGNTYKLSGEFDVEALVVGTEVVLAYDTIEGEKTVTDLVTYE